MTIEICIGVNKCSVCGASMIPGAMQNCPSPLRSTAETLLATGAKLDTKCKEGLGELAEEFFGYCGLTKETYVGLKGSLGLMETCNCDTRKEWLNRFGEATGIGDAASKFSDWLLDRHRKANTHKPPST